MQIDRLFSITYHLLSHKKATAQELADSLGVSARTILRDIDVLSLAGIPVYTSQGTGGGIFLDSSFVLNKTMLTSEEQQKIILALRSLSATGQLEAEPLLHKLGHLFSQSYSDIIEVDFSRWGAPHTDKVKFGQLVSAAMSWQKITFSYIDMYANVSNRRVNPIGLRFHSKSWYLYAFCEDKRAYRTFKINRISDLEILDEYFDKSALPEPSQEEESGAHAELIHLELRFLPSVTYRLYDDFDASDIIVDNKGISTVSIDVPENDWLYGFILSFGNSVEVIAPEHIRNKICETASEILKNYSR